MLGSAQSPVALTQFGPHDQWIFGTQDGNARLWDATSGELLATLEGHTGDIISLVFQNDGSRIITGSTDATVRVWDTPSGQTLAVFDQHADRISAIDFNEQTQSLISGSWDSKVVIYPSHYLDYRDLLDYACTRVHRNLINAERRRFGIVDGISVCSGILEEDVNPRPTHETLVNPSGE